MIYQITAFDEQGNRFPGLVLVSANIMQRKCDELIMKPSVCVVVAEPFHGEMSQAKTIREANFEQLWIKAELPSILKPQAE